MRLVKLIFLVLLVVESTGCENSIETKENSILNLFQARMWFTGRWKLTKQSSMVTYRVDLPNVELIISNDRKITILRDGKLIDKVDFELILENHELRLSTNAQPRPDNWYVRNPSVRIFRNWLFLDTGMAGDSPAFEFMRMK